MTSTNETKPAPPEALCEIHWMHPNNERVPCVRPATHIEEVEEYADGGLGDDVVVDRTRVCDECCGCAVDGHGNRVGAKDLAEVSR